MEIVVRQSQGLGNQLFQYAAGMYYAKRYNATLRIALEPRRLAHSLGDPRPFLLSNFHITAPFREITKLERLVVAPVSHWKKAPSAMAAKFFGMQVVSEPVTDFYQFRADLAIRPRVRSVYLAGLWQFQSHLKVIEKDLRDELRFREPPVGRNLEVLTQIQQTDTPVSVHVRSTDFLFCFGSAGILSAKYYQDATRVISDRFPSAAFFVFSDDVDFARQQLSGLTRAVFVDHNNASSAHEDLRLMTACSHNIIANSTFSWWGAWLNPSPAKLVVAPRRWPLQFTRNNHDLLPPNWIVLQ